MAKKWYLYAKKADFKGIAERLSIDPVTVRVLRNRDIEGDEEIRRFLFGGLDELEDESRLPDAGRAVRIIAEKIREQKPIRVVGDYDIDGVCASYIMVTVLRSLGAKADFVIPDRIRDGYGINSRIIEEAGEAGINTLITVDNGISAIDELRLAKELGLTVVVTDHHEIRRDADDAELIPEADAVVDPKLSSSAYAMKDICGAVVAWKLARLLLRELNGDEELWLSLLPFAAIATVGDVMPLKSENRIIVREGLKRINESRRKLNTGLYELIRACGLLDKELSAYHIGFVIGPCINAGGRLETAYDAMELFLSGSHKEAEALALHLKDLNDERKAMTERGVEKAAALAEGEFSKDKVLLIELPKLHESLAGIVAGRIRERFSKPAIVITDTDTKGVSKGSGRSIENYNMFEGLLREQDIFIKFGGHPMAAGLSLNTDRIGELRLRLNRHCGLKEDDLCEKIWIDAELPFSYITEGLINELSSLAPFGNGNERPLFAQKELRASDIRVLGKNKNVLRFLLRNREGRALPAVMFGEAEELSRRLVEKDTFSALYYPQINEFNGRRSIQLTVLDFI